MNFLGHFYTAASDRSLMVGSFLGDFLKGPVEDHRTIYQPGLRLHRAVDAIGDRTESFRENCRRLRSSSDRYATVVADIVNDHLLASGWNDFSALPLESFVAGCHEAIASGLADFPSVPRSVATRMIEEGWLESYASLEGLALSLERFRRRIRPPLEVDRIVRTVEQERLAMMSSFRGFLLAVETHPRIAGLRSQRPDWVILSSHGA